MYELLKSTDSLLVNIFTFHHLRTYLNYVRPQLHKRYPRMDSWNCSSFGTVPLSLCMVAVLLVYVDNTFNRLNRAVALYNIQYFCPPLATVLINIYRLPTRLSATGGLELSSEESTTQGCLLSMAMFALSVVPLINECRNTATDDHAQGFKHLPQNMDCSLAASREVCTNLCDSQRACPSSALSLPTFL